MPNTAAVLNKSTTLTN